MKKLLVIFILIFCNADNLQEIKMDRELSDLIDSYWSDYVKHKGKDYIVRKSIPIVWFGDIEAYKKSKIKVVTIGINPSNNEFPNGADREPSFSRFPNAEKLYAKESLTQEDKILLVETLNGYFKNEPYMKWFNGFEKPLNVLGVSYKSGENIALHIDIYTALATKKKWSELTQEQRDTIQGKDTQGKIEENIRFKKLLNYLKPSVIIYSSNYEQFKKIFLQKGQKPLEEYSYKTDKNKTMRITPFCIDGRLVIFGSNVRGNPLQLKDDFIKDKFSEIQAKFLQKGMQ